MYLERFCSHWDVVMYSNALLQSQRTKQLYILYTVVNGVLVPDNPVKLWVFACYMLHKAL